MCTSMSGVPNCLFGVPLPFLGSCMSMTWETLVFNHANAYSKELSQYLFALVCSIVVFSNNGKLWVILECLHQLLTIKISSVPFIIYCIRYYQLLKATGKGVFPMHVCSNKSIGPEVVLHCCARS